MLTVLTFPTISTPRSPDYGLLVHLLTFFVIEAGVNMNLSEVLRG